MMHNTILITGASRGIGAALAHHYAAPGVRLGLIGRDLQCLSDVAKTCIDKGAEVEHASLDVTNRDAMQVWIEAFDQHYPVDLLITSAGVTEPATPDGMLEPQDKALQLLDINLNGTLYAVYPLVQRMRARGHGQIAFISSLAAYFGMPVTPAYCASKSAIKAYGEALRGLLAPQGIRVNVVCPGFVESDLSEKFPGKRPFMLSPAQAATLIAKGLDNNRAIIAFPWQLSLGMKSLQWMPFKLASYFLGLTGYNRVKKQQS